jgi:hypothetical protein
MTPTTSADTPLIRTRRPITPASAPKRARHSPSPSTTTGAASGRSSPGWMTRPRAAGTRTTSNTLAVT